LPLRHRKQSGKLLPLLAQGCRDPAVQQVGSYLEYTGRGICLREGSPRPGRNQFPSPSERPLAESRIEGPRGYDGASGVKKFVLEKSKFANGFNAESTVQSCRE